MASWTKHADSFLKSDILLDPKKANALRLYDYLLLSAFKRPGRKDGVEIPRGSVPKTEKDLARILNLTRQEFRTALSVLISANKIAVTKYTGFTVFSVIDYDCDFKKPRHAAQNDGKSSGFFRRKSNSSFGNDGKSSGFSSFGSAVRNDDGFDLKCSRQANPPADRSDGSLDCDFQSIQPQKQPQKQPRKKVQNAQCFQGLRDFENELNNHENNHTFNHGNECKKEIEKSKEEEKEKRTKKEKEEEKKKDKEKYCGGGGDACAREEREDGDSTVSVIEAACGFDRLEMELSGLPEDTRLRFRQTADILFQRFFGRIPSHFDRLSLFSLLRFSLYSSGDSFRLSEDDVELLTLAFKAAAEAGHSDLAYLHGVFRRFRKRGIRTPSDFYAFELSRAGIL